MQQSKSKAVISPESIWIGLLFAGCGAAMVTAMGFGHAPTTAPIVAGVPIPPSQSPPKSTGENDRASTGLPWRLNNPLPGIIPANRANPAAVADKFAARMRAIEQRALLRAYEGAPPVIPHPIADLNVQTCRACHAQGLRAGEKVAKMVSHTYLANCTQCHVETSSPMLGTDAGPANTFVGLQSSGYGGTRAWAGAPPVMPHTTFMRINCVSCHGENGYDGWRPDHLSRSNCVQCHAPAAQFDQLSPVFGIPDVPDGRSPDPNR